MERLTEKEVIEIMLQEIEDYMDMFQIDRDNIKGPSDLVEALDGFQSSIFMEYEEQEQKELMWSIYTEDDGRPGIEIIEL